MDEGFLAIGFVERTPSHPYLGTQSAPRPKDRTLLTEYYTPVCLATHFVPLVHGQARLTNAAVPAHVQDALEREDGTTITQWYKDVPLSFDCFMVRRQNIWSIANDLSRKLSLRPITPIPMTLETLTDFAHVLEGTIDSIAQARGCIQQTPWFDSQLRDACHGLLSSLSSYVTEPWPERKQSLMEARDHLKTYFPSELHFRIELDTHIENSDYTRAYNLISEQLCELPPRHVPK
jgi:hypothetical protein